MPNRPAIPMDIQRELLFECRYRCALRLDRTGVHLDASSRPALILRDHQL